ncbi:MAG TPA: FkbM family methyltransferase [Polyangiales bacterium]
MELPGWGKLLSLAHTDPQHNARWRGAGWIEIRCKPHGYRVRLDLSAAFERSTYFLARYSELDTELVMRHFLRPGDQFVDGGANIGMLSLMAAHLVGPTGHVHAFEPNPAVYQRLLEHLDLNGLRGLVTPYRLGLSNMEASLRLRIVNDDFATGTVATLPDELVPHVTGEFTIRVAPGDDLLADTLLPERRTLIKLDVEGHEAEAVEGLRTTIDSLRPALLTEVNPERFTPAHPCRLFPVLLSRGYRCYEIGLRRGGVMRQELTLRPVRAFAELIAQCDLLWLPPGESFGFERFTES